MQIDFKILDLTLHLIRLGMGIDKEPLISDVDIAAAMPGVYKLAKHHDVAHIVAYAVKKYGIKCDEETAKKLDKKYLVSIFRYQHQMYDLSVILNAFEEAGIAHIPLKGSVLRAYYPQQWMRTGCDIDILVKEEELDRAKDTLVKIGYNAGFKMTHDILLESPGGTHVELHFDLIEKDKHGPDTVLEEFFNDASAKEGKTYHLESSPEMFIYYHIRHMAKHIVNGGCGIRSLLDLYVIKSRISYDEDRLFELLSEGGFLKFAKTVFALSDAWFAGGKMDELTERVANYIASGGIYGNIENMVAVKTTKKGSRAGYILHRIFLPYEELRFSYPSLTGKKWLTPVYWVARFFRIVFSKRLRYSLKEIKEGVSANKSKTDAMAKFLSDIGLDK